ncbi:hypothetical protein [Nocardia terpenica]|uniref:hypothetical protein n=1 Tax=Nocardia terpenica TaxID=455432 RepID=UPI0012FD0AC9|nr:hypothetical protein [Nocardia terpenica]
MDGARPNAELRRILEEIGWSPYELARAVNRAVSSDRRIHLKTPFAWRDRGTVPRDPLPAVVAGILTEARGEVITVEQLWPGRSHRTEVWLPAIARVAEAPWTVGDTLVLLEEFRTPGDAKTFFAVSGGELTSLADRWASVNHPLLAKDSVAGRGSVTADFIDYLERDLAELRRLDDGHGGELVLRAVTHRLAQAVDLVNGSSYPARIGKRLLSIVGQMAQLAGWLGFDLGRHGFAQRMYLLGLRAATSSGDRQLGALVLSCIAFQQTWRNRPHDAVSIMSTVGQDSRGAATPRVQALTAMREARAFATTGMQLETSRALDRAFDALARGAHDNDPAWTYWMDTTVLTSEAGRCYLHLGDTRRAESQLAEGLARLGPNATRDRVLYGLSLALAHVRGTGGRQDLELACYEADQVLPLLPEVGSARCRSLIETITVELRPHRSTAAVRAFLDKSETLRRSAIC